MPSRRRLPSVFIYLERSLWTAALLALWYLGTLFAQQGRWAAMGLAILGVVALGGAAASVWGLSEFNARRR